MESVNGVGARSWRAAAAKPLHCRESPRHIRQRSVDPVSMALIAESQQRRWEGVVQASRSTGRLQLRGASLDAGSAATVVQLLLSEEKQPWHVDLEGNELGDRGALCVAELLRQSTHLAWLGLGACGIGDSGVVDAAGTTSAGVSVCGIAGMAGRSGSSENGRAMLRTTFSELTVLIFRFRGGTGVNVIG